MADFQGAFVQAGRDLKATNFGNGLNTPVTYLEVGSGTTAPTLTDTALETPFHPPRRFDAPAGLASGDSYQFDFVDDGADAYSVTEVGIFSGGSVAAGGGTLLFRFVLATAIAKPANTRARYPLVGQIAGEDLDSLSFAVAITSSAVANWSDTIAGKVQRATPAEAEATSGHSNVKGLSVLRGWQQLNAWWNALTIAASKIPNLPASKITSGVFNVARIPSSIARIASPTFTGSPTAPTPGPTNNSTRIATTAWVRSRIDTQVPDASTTVKGKAELATSAELRSVLGGTDPASASEGNVLTLQTLFDSFKAYAEVPAVTTSGSGSGARVGVMEVSATGQITAVTWASAGSGYAAADVLTFTQGAVTGDYTLLAADVSSGELQNLTGKTIGSGFIASRPAAAPPDGTIEIVYEA